MLTSLIPMGEGNLRGGNANVDRTIGRNYNRADSQVTRDLGAITA